MIITVSSTFFAGRQNGQSIHDSVHYVSYNLRMVNFQISRPMVFVSSSQSFSCGKIKYVKNHAAKEHNKKCHRINEEAINVGTCSNNHIYSVTLNYELLTISLITDDILFTVSNCSNNSQVFI